MSNRLSNFPHLTAPEFLSAISSIHRLFHQRGSSSCFHPWISMDIARDLETDYLRITTPLSTNSARQTNSLSVGSRSVLHAITCASSKLALTTHPSETNMWRITIVMKKMRWKKIPCLRYQIRTQNASFPQPALMTQREKHSFTTILSSRPPTRSLSYTSV